MKIVAQAKGLSWRLTKVETDHSFHYITEYRHANILPDGKVRFIWAVSDGKCIIKPEFLAQSTQIQGKAIADASEAIRQAQQGGNECPICLGSKVQPDNPGKSCGACNGSGRKA